jgi:hypothetical protein
VTVPLHGSSRPAESAGDPEHGSSLIVRDAVGAAMSDFRFVRRLLGQLIAEVRIGIGII